MKIIAVIGSGRADGNSSKVMYQMIKGAQDAGNEVKVYNINDIDLKGCQGCRTCRTMNCDCVIDDGLREYFEDLHTAEALLISAPNYYSQVSGQMMIFMNRHYCMSDDNKNPRLDHKVKLVTVFSQGAAENYAKYLPTYDWYISTFESKNFELVSKVIIGGDSDVSDEGKIMLDAYNTGKNL